MVRWFWGAAFASLLATTAWCQTADDTLQTAYDNLRGEQWASFQLLGTDTVGVQVSPLEVDANWSSPVGVPNPLTQLSLESLRSNVQYDFWVADGTQLWRYADDANQYQAATYGAFAGATPPNYVDSLLQSLVAESRGPALYVSRLLRDVYAGPQATYKSWVPQTTPVVTTDETTTTISYGNAIKTVVFTVDTSSGNLKKIDYTATQGIRAEAWELTITTFNARPLDWRFTFTPPPDAQPVALPSSGH